MTLCECGAGLSRQKLAYAITPETEHHLVERGEVRQFTVSIMAAFMCTAEQGRLHKFHGWTFSYANRDILHVYCTVITVDPRHRYGVIVLLMVKSSVTSDLISAGCILSAWVVKSAVWTWLVSHSFNTGWWFEVMVKMMMTAHEDSLHEGNPDRSV